MDNKDKGRGDHTVIPICLASSQDTYKSQARRPQAWRHFLCPIFPLPMSYIFTNFMTSVVTPVTVATLDDLHYTQSMDSELMKF